MSEEYKKIVKKLEKEKTQIEERSYECSLSLEEALKEMEAQRQTSDKKFKKMLEDSEKRLQQKELIFNEEKETIRKEISLKLEYF